MLLLIQMGSQDNGSVYGYQAEVRVEQINGDAMHQIEVMRQAGRQVYEIVFQNEHSLTLKIKRIAGRPVKSV